MADTPVHDLAHILPREGRPRLVIVGGGFAGLHLAKRLSRAELQIVMLDRINFHTFQPLLYQVATAMLEPDAVANSFRKIFRKQDNFHFRLVDVERIDPAGKTVHTSAGSLDYDLLVLATGARTNFYGMQDMEDNAYVLKEVSHSIAIRQRIFRNFEKALLANTEGERRELMNIVIVGGGPTGIEIAGAMGELKKFILPHDYRELDLQHMRIYLVEAGEQLLAGMSDKASRLARETLETFGVTVMLRTTITGYNGRTATTGDGKKLPTRMLIWVAGVSGNIPAGLDRADILAGDRVRVDVYSQVPGYQDLYAIGDVAAMCTDKLPSGHPMLAPVAIQQAANLAGNICRRLAGDGTLRPFTYKDRGIMATIGRNRAVVERRKMSFDGFPAWLAWLFVHLITLIGFRNKLLAIINWGWNYMTYDRGIRLIIPAYRGKGLREEPEEGGEQ